VKWTDESRAIVAGMKRAGLSNTVIAARLGCTAKAVTYQAGKMGARRRLDGNGGRGTSGPHHQAGRIFRATTGYEGDDA